MHRLHGNRRKDDAAAELLPIAAQSLHNDARGQIGFNLSAEPFDLAHELQKRWNCCRAKVKAVDAVQDLAALQERVEQSGWVTTLAALDFSGNA